MLTKCVPQFQHHNTKHWTNMTIHARIIKQSLISMLPNSHPNILALQTVVQFVQKHKSRLSLLFNEPIKIKHLYFLNLFVSKAMFTREQYTVREKQRTIFYECHAHNMPVLMRSISTMLVKPFLLIRLLKQTSARPRYYQVIAC